jgi:hypothetical protein
MNLSQLLTFSFSIKTEWETECITLILRKGKFKLEMMDCWLQFFDLVLWVRLFILSLVHLVGICHNWDFINPWTKFSMV